MIGEKRERKKNETLNEKRDCESGEGERDKRKRKM